MVILAILDGRMQPTVEDWELAGLVVEESNRVRGKAQASFADAHRRRNTARAHEQAEREAFVSERLTEARSKRVHKAITSKLGKVKWCTRKDLRNACDSSIRDDFNFVFEMYLDEGFLVEEVRGSATGYRFK